MFVGYSEISSVFVKYAIYYIYQDFCLLGQTFLVPRGTRQIAGSWFTRGLSTQLEIMT